VAGFDSTQLAGLEVTGDICPAYEKFDNGRGWCSFLGVGWDGREEAPGFESVDLKFQIEGARSLTI
jgi:hypothetical protein